MDDFEQMDAIILKLLCFLTLRFFCFKREIRVIQWGAMNISALRSSPEFQSRSFAYTVSSMGHPNVPWLAVWMP